MKPFILLSACLLMTAMIGCTKTEPEATKMEHGQAEHKHDDTHAHYTCSMHPEVMADAPGQCPKCGMDLEMMDEGAHTGLHDATKFKMDFQTMPSTVAPSQPVALRFTPQSADKGATLKNLQIVHEKPLHLLMVSNDLSWFAHEHPEVKADGSYELAYRFPKADTYYLYADITPEGSSHNQVFKLEKAVGQGTSGEPRLTVSNTFAAEGYGYKMRSEPTELTAGKSATIVVMVSKKDKPVTNLENYLGALGHMVIISDDREAFLHAHPEEHAHTAAEMKDPSHSHVSFMTLFPKAGKYKIWVQFNVDGKVRTAQFVVSVS